MAAEQQLERSVLERKERDELRAIAQAMALDTNSRSKKADIVNQILRAAGVEVPTSDAADPIPKPTRARSKRAVDPTEPDSAAAAATEVTGIPPVFAASATGVANGHGLAQSGPADTVPFGSASSTSTLVGAAPLSTGSSVQEQVSGGREPRPRSGRASAAGRSGIADAIAEASAEALQISVPRSESSDARSNGEGAANSDNGPSALIGTGDHQNSAEPDRHVGNAGRAQGREGRSSPGGGQGRQSNSNGQNNNGQNNNGQNNNANNAGNGDRVGAANEAGNRRNRRRRGRERGAPGETREPQGSGGQEQPYQGELVTVSGLLDLRDEGYGFLRANGYLPSPKDVYVSISQARRFGLRKGDHIEGACRPAASNEKFPALIRIDNINAAPSEEAQNRPRFEDLTPLFPDSKLVLESAGSHDNVTARIIDLLCPIGKGQRGLIVSPPKAGKTTVMKQIAHSIESNHPEVHLMVLLVDERPEEVTDMRRTVKGEVIASTFDRPSEEHTAVAELAIERAKRLVEHGRDVVIILDGITRLARAYNLAQPTSGRIMSGGVDSGALYPPKKFFGAARNIEEGGSLTILATALVETGSKMDEVIFEEFKGTGNMELRLDRRLAERRLYPSIEVNASSTRHEELLFERGQLQQVWKLRRVLNALAGDNNNNSAPGLELLMDRIRKTASNDEFLADIAKGPAPT